MPDARADPRDDTDLVVAARTSEPSAYGVLFQRWFDRCYDVAWNISRNRDTAAEVTQDAFLAGWEGLGDLRDPAAFGGWILRATRNRALNRLARDRNRQDEVLPDETRERWAMTDDLADPVAATEIADRRRLVWTASRALGERDMSLLDLHLRHGLDPAEIAQELGVTANNAHQLLFRLRGKLRDIIGAALLWREGSPSCPALASLVPAQAGFDEPTAAAIRRHQRDCTPCSTELAAQTHPERLFAALPLALVPLGLREGVQARLVAQGVPMQPTTVPGSDGGSGGGSGGGGRDEAPTPASGVDPSRSSAARRRTRVLLAATVAALLAAGAGVAVSLARRAPTDVTAATPSAAAPTLGPPEPSLAPVGTGAIGTSTHTSAETTTGRPRTSSTRPGAQASDPATEPPRTPTPTPTSAPPMVSVTVDGPVDVDQPDRCPSRTLNWVIAWRITDATAAVLAVPGGTRRIEPAPGSTTACLAPGAQVSVTATGPGGRAAASDSADITPEG